jgi:hypothetical protein
MTQVVRVKSDGSVAVLFALGQPALTFQTDDPLLPTAIASGLAASLAAMSAAGASLVHMEQDATRTFTHTVIDGQVIYQGSISDPVFSAIMAAQAVLVSIFDPE